MTHSYKILYFDNNQEMGSVELMVSTTLEILTVGNLKFKKLHRVYQEYLKDAVTFLKDVSRGQAIAIALDQIAKKTDLFFDITSVKEQRASHDFKEIYEYHKKFTENKTVSQKELLEQALKFLGVLDAIINNKKETNQKIAETASFFKNFERFIKENLQLN